MDSPSSIESQIKYGLDGVDDGRSVSIPLKDLLFIKQTLGEFVRFFHQPAHYPDIEHVIRFLGDRDTEALGALWRCYYDVLGECWPDDIEQKYDKGDFDNPTPPFYYQPDGDE